MRDERFERGLGALTGISPEGAEAVLKGLEDIAPDMAEYMVAFGYGDIFSRPGLDAATRETATLAILTALGNARPQLKWHIRAALNVGILPSEIIEIMYVQTVYSGFPAGLNGISAASEVFREQGVAFTPVKWRGEGEPRSRGMKALDEISSEAGRAVMESLADVAPDMADFIIDFSYGTIFCRDILTPVRKEVVAIAGMAASGTMMPQLKVHIQAGLNVGLTKEQIIEIMIHTCAYAGFPAALNGIAAAREVFARG